MLILASASPQRKTLLEQIGITPIVIPADIDETLDDIDINASLKSLAEQKARATIERINTDSFQTIAFSNLREFWIIGADTVVLLDDAILGKPSDENSASGMVESMAGRSHRVLTGVCAGKVLRDADGDFTFKDVEGEMADTEVFFKSLSPQETSWYISTGEWHGAAGAYRIQGRGACLVEGISGSFSNVVGLPIELIYGMLTRLGFSFEA
jgi:septum formation protein